MKVLKTLLLFGCLILVSVSYGQDRPRSERSAERVKERGAQFNKMVAELKLSKDQAETLKEINQDYRSKMRKIRQENEGDRPAMRSKMQELRTNQQAEIKDIMTEEQFTAFQKIMKEQRTQRGGRRY